MATVDQYRHQLAALLPPGIALTAEPDSELDILLHKLAAQLAPVAGTATQLQQDALPTSTAQLLDAWETAFNLPDELLPLSAGQPERQAWLLSKVTDLGGARIPRYLQLVRQLGFEQVQIKRLKPFTTRSPCGDGVWRPDARFAWVLRVADTSPLMPLSALQALIHREAPGITIPIILET